MSGECPRDVRSSWWFACQPGVVLSAYVHFHFLPVAISTTGRVPWPPAGSSPRGEPRAAHRRCDAPP
eukprot:10032757-Alexandrium_andersonii.AAC.1